MQQDEKLQDILDPDKNGKGIRILRRIEQPPEGITTAYYVDGGQEFAGRSRWVEVDSKVSDAKKAKAIRDELAA